MAVHYDCGASGRGMIFDGERFRYRGFYSPELYLKSNLVRCANLSQEMKVSLYMFSVLLFLTLEYDCIAEGICWFEVVKNRWRLAALVQRLYSYKLHYVREKWQVFKHSVTILILKGE
jgi:hypothetical protein